MIDTIQFTLPEGSYFIEKDNFQPSCEALKHKFFYMKDKRLFPRIEMRDKNETYYPQVSLYEETNRGADRKINMKVEVSVAKMINGNNLFSIRETDKDVFIKNLIETLDKMGVKTTYQAIEKAICNKGHFAVNIIVPVSPEVIIEDMARAVIPAKTDCTTDRFSKGGYCMHYHLDCKEVAIYDKFTEISANKPKKSVCANNILKNISKVEVEDYQRKGVYVLRFEARFNTKAELEKIFNKKNIRVEDLFDDNKIKEVICRKWNEIKEGMYKLPKEKLTARELLEEIIRKNPKIKITKIERLFGYCLILQENGGVSLRKQLKKHSSKVQVRRIMKEIKDLKIPKYKPDYIRYLDKEIKRLAFLDKKMLDDVKTSKIKLKIRMDMKMNNFMTVEEVAEQLDVAVMTVYRKIKSGELIAYKIGKRLRIKKEDLHNFITSCKVGDAK